MLYWFALLFWSICLEGLGRKYMPTVPSVAFYFLKDIVLLIGYFKYPPSAIVRTTAKSFYGVFQFFWLAAFGWTVIELFNPELGGNLSLGLLGLRAYWVWWIAPIIVAGVLQNPTVKRRAIYVLLFTSIGIAIFAAVQFASPPTSDVNIYSVVNGETVYADTATVAQTGRARVSSTFSFVTGFGNFVVLIPTLLLSIGIGTEDKTLRKYALVATSMSAAVLPMSGSRATVLLGGVVLILTAWTAGLFFTKVGRRVMIGALAGAILATTAFPDAFIGVSSRFENSEETSGRFMEMFDYVPIVSIVNAHYPMAGLGTGMAQNARFSMGEMRLDYYSEGENGRYLIELGPVGYLIYWTAKIGLGVALFRCYQVLKRAGRRATAGAALSYAFLAPLGNLTFDHVWQALFFLGCGFILSEVVSVLRKAEVPRPPQTPLPLPRPLTLPR